MGNETWYSHAHKILILFVLWLVSFFFLVIVSSYLVEWSVVVLLLHSLLLSTLPLFQLKMDNFRTAFAGYDDQDDFVEDDFHLRVR